MTRSWKNRSGYFQKKRRRTKPKCEKSMENDRINYLKEYNIRKSWYNSFEEEIESQWDSLNASRKKILLPEEEELDCETECPSDGECSDDELWSETETKLYSPKRKLLIDIELLQTFMKNNCICKDCGKTQTIYEDENFRQGLGTKLVFRCSKECVGSDSSCFTSKKTSNSIPPFTRSKEYLLSPITLITTFPPSLV